MSTLRLRRLSADYEKLQEYVERHPRLKLLRASGEPPELYQLEYRIRSLRQTGDGLDFVGTHTVEILLPRDYPKSPPQCRMLTPVFHPNIAPHAICVGDHWSAGEPIGSIVARIGEMLAYQSYNTKSPLNGEAARWVEQNLEQLPLDKVNMLVQAAPPAVGAAAPREPVAAPRGPRRPAVVAPADRPPPIHFAEAPPAPTASRRFISFECGSCGERYRVSIESQGKRARCKRCQTIMTVPPPSAPAP
jgi:ubiquitin-protein ligase